MKIKCNLSGIRVQSVHSIYDGILFRRLIPTTSWKETSREFGAVFDGAIKSCSEPSFDRSFTSEEVIEIEDSCDGNCSDKFWDDKCCFLENFETGQVNDDKNAIGNANVNAKK